MRILDEKNLSVIWSWGQLERDELATRFQANLDKLLHSVHKWVQQENRVSGADLQGLAEELQDAADTLEACTARCYTMSRALNSLAEDDAATRKKRMQHLEALNAAIGKPVVLTRTSIEELRGKTLILERIKGTKAIVRDGDDYWETPVEQVELVTTSSSSTS